MPPPRTAVLKGRDHTRLGAHAVAEIGAALAVAMTAGANARSRPSYDPNEDSGAILDVPGASALIAADGHFGHESAECVVDFVVDALGADPPDARLSEAQLVRMFFDAGVAVQRETTRATCPHPDSRTTLVLAVVACDAVHWAAFGDSSIVLVGKDGGIRVDTPRAVYLGDRFTHIDVGNALTRGRVPRDDIACVVCATDGLEHGLARGDSTLEGAVASETAEASTAREVAEGLIARALSAGVDDAVTVAVALS
jgi:Protein phosphatase 2C